MYQEYSLEMKEENVWIFVEEAVTESVVSGREHTS